MKKILSIATVVASIFTAHSQNINYDFFNTNQNLGNLFMEDNQYGTARFEAMSGAFGALGGDISAVDVNPAGASVAKSSLATVSLYNRDTDLGINYYGNQTNSNNNELNISQGGAILVFDTHHEEWTRFALSFNYRLKKDFNRDYLFTGNSNYIFHSEHLNDTQANKTQFDRSLNQRFSYSARGENSAITVGFSALHQKKLHIGAALSFHNIELAQNSLLQESNDDVTGDILDTEDYIEDIISGNGISFSLGFIYKPNKQVRLGLAYETPTWYGEILNDYLDETVHHATDDFNRYIEGNAGGLSYNFRTPSRITASGAYIFGKQGLVSFDYTYKNYSNVKYGNHNSDDLNVANNFFANNFRNTSTLNVGTEWRFDRASIRGGYHYQKNHNTNANLGGNTNEDNQEGFSLGFGYNFGSGFKVDLSYRKYENIEYNTIYNLGDAQINNNTSRITGTVVFEL